MDHSSINMFLNMVLDSSYAMGVRGIFFAEESDKKEHKEASQVTWMLVTTFRVNCFSSAEERARALKETISSV